MISIRSRSSTNAFVAIRHAIVATSLVWVSAGLAVHAAGEFPFGLEITLDAPPMVGSERIPNLEIGERGEVRFELWCKGGAGQFSVAGNTVVFVAGPIEKRTCPAAQSAADDELLAALGGATNWSRSGDTLTFTGARTLRFQLNTN